MKYKISFVSGFDLKYKVAIIEAEDKEKAVEKLFSMEGAAFDNSLVSVKEVEEWTKREQYDILFRHFMDCVRYWESRLNIDSDLSNEAYKRALNEIPTTHPGIAYNAPKIDDDVRNGFIKDRCMDTYGKFYWEKEYENLVKR